MSNSLPNHHDAELVLKLYDLAPRTGYARSAQFDGHLQPAVDR